MHQWLLTASPAGEVAAKTVKKISSYKRPSSTIYVQDSAEQKMDGQDDSLALFNPGAQILTQWIGTSYPPPGGLGLLYGGYDFTWEWYRHSRQDQTVWVDGHASNIRWTGLKVGIDYRHYTGEIPDKSVE